MHYLRFGEIPENEKSINFLKMTFEQQEDFNYFCNEEGDISRALECVPADALEDGVSVFEMAPNGFPVLASLRMVSSLLLRLEMPAYDVAGVEVGRGNDGEPLINNISIVERLEISKEELLEYCINTLRENFKNASFDSSQNYGSNKLFSSLVEEKRNAETGERVSAWETTEGDKWEKLPPYTEYVLNGWSFSNPVEGFDVELGSIQ